MKKYGEKIAKIGLIIAIICIIYVALFFILMFFSAKSCDGGGEFCGLWLFLPFFPLFIGGEYVSELINAIPIGVILIVGLLSIITTIVIWVFLNKKKQEISKGFMVIVALAIFIIGVFLTKGVFYKFDNEDVVEWGHIAAEKNDPNVCINKIGGYDELDTEMNLIYCLEVSAVLSGDLKFCEEISNISEYEYDYVSCVNQVNMAHSISTQKCKGSTGHNTDCIDDYCVNYIWDIGTSLELCLSDMAKKELDTTWCELIIDYEDSKDSEKCFESIGL